MSDPRFKGYTDSLGSDDEAAQQEPKDFPVGFMPAVFDRVLSGWFVDAKKQVDATTIACNIDDQYDISAELTYTVQYLKYGGLKYNWRAEVPEKLLDDRVHRVRILAFEANGRGHCLSTPVTLSPLRVPAINAVVYPWRDVTLRPEDQKEDPLRILVLLDAKVRPEWEASYVALSSWRLENEKGPLSVTLDPSRGAIVLDVAEPLKSNTTLYLGPVELEPGLKCSDDEPIRLPGAQTDSICWCGTLTSKLYQTHGYWEGEHNAWAYEFHVPDECDAEVAANWHTIIFLANSPVVDFWAPEDTETYVNGTITEPGNLAWAWHGVDTLMGHNSYKEAYYYAISSPCVDPWKSMSPSQIASISVSFDGDVTNPEFVEQPYFMSGPQAAAWIRGYVAEYGTRAHPENPAIYEQWVSHAEENLCGIYIPIHIYDPGRPMALNVYHIDWLYGADDFQSTSGSDNGPAVWIDRLPECTTVDPGGELIPWYDPNHNPYEADGDPVFEEVLDIYEITPQQLEGLTALRVRAIDMRLNWKRSDILYMPIPQDYSKGNEQQEALLDEGGQQWHVVDLIFRDSNIYPDEPCYHVGSGDDDRRVECDGYVAPRPGGDTTLDICAHVQLDNSLVWTPACVEVTLSAPLDEPNRESMTVYLYQLSQSSPDYADIRDDLNCGVPMPPPNEDNCIDLIYCRGENRIFYGPAAGSHPPLVVASDHSLKQQPESWQYGLTPILPVTSKDVCAAEMDIKDFAIARGIDDGTGQYQYYAPVVQNLRTQLVGYGQANRGLYDNNGCITGGSGATDQQDNYADNVGTFGQEYVVAQVSGMDPIHNPVQSEADIMFAFVHGVEGVGGQANGIGPFLDWQGGWKQTIIGASYWRVYHQDLIGRDSKWLASTACSLLADGFYSAWRELCQSEKLFGVLGFRKDKPRTDPVGGGIIQRQLFDDNWFWSKFAEYLNAPPDPNTGLPPCANANHWDPTINLHSVDRGAICYMEAAFAYFDHYGAGSTFTGRRVEIAAAVDAAYRYSLAVDQELPPNAMIRIFP